MADKTRKPTFTIATLLLVTALIVVGISHIHTSLELDRVKTELTVARNELTDLDADDKRRIYAAFLPTYGPMQWRWRVQLPVDGTYRICSAFAKIPQSGFPAKYSRHNFVFIDSRANPLPGGEPFILSLAFFKDLNGVWKMTTGHSLGRTELPPYKTHLRGLMMARLAPGLLTSAERKGRSLPLLMSDWFCSDTVRQKRFFRVA